MQNWEKAQEHQQKSRLESFTGPGGNPGPFLTLCSKGMMSASCAFIGSYGIHFICGDEKGSWEQCHGERTECYSDSVLWAGREKEETLLNQKGES